MFVYTRTHISVPTLCPASTFFDPTHLWWGQRVCVPEKGESSQISHLLLIFSHANNAQIGNIPPLKEAKAFHREEGVQWK